MEGFDSHSTTPAHRHMFYHEMKLTTAQKIRAVLLGSVLCPLRLTLVILCFLIMWPIARLRMVGLSAEERARPVRGWRRWLIHPPVFFLSRAVFFFLGFLWFRVKGRRAGLKEAPVLAVAPHSSFLDMLIFIPTDLATVVSRSENTSLPVIGALLEFNQAVLVTRKDPESRKQCVNQIRERLTSNGRWPQMIMFPEGTTTNGSGLIKFKPGAFMAGVPVQPVLLLYPNKLDTVRWTWKGTSWFQALLCTAAQLHTNVTVEYLPVYTPSQEEKDDPNLYADNVQKLMAKALGIPATDYMMEGRYPVRQLGGLSLPVEPPARETLSLLRNAGLSISEVKAALNRMIDSCHAGQEEFVSVDQLATLLGVADRRTAAKICALYSKEEVVDIRLIYLSVVAVSGYWSLEFVLHKAFTLYAKESKDGLSAKELGELMGALVGIPQRHTDTLYQELKNRGRFNEGELLAVLTTHPIYQKLFAEYLQPEEANPTKLSSSSTNGRASTHNGEMRARMSVSNTEGISR